MHYVFKTNTGLFVGTRKETGEGYARRVTLVTSRDEARVFNTKAAATNAAAGHEGEAKQVHVVEL